MRADLVSGILPVLPDGRVLVLQRPTGTWEPPAGRLHAGEGFESGARRELYEETGLVVEPGPILATWVGASPGGRTLAAVTYAGRTDEEAVSLSDEHLGFRWVTIEEWLDLPSWWSPANIRRAAGPVAVLRDPPAKPSANPSARSPAVPLRPPAGETVARAVLGSGVVIADVGGAEPRALLLRRRKPPVGLWENPGGALEAGEDFEGCARREAREETGLRLDGPLRAWWTRVEPWKAPDDPELYAGVGFLAEHPGGEVRLEDSAHDAQTWATEDEWRGFRTWYTEEDSDILWTGIRNLRP